MILSKLECSVYQNIYIFYFILLYTRRAISTQTNPKSLLVEKSLITVEFKLAVMNAFKMFFNG